MLSASLEVSMHLTPYITKLFAQTLEQQADQLVLSLDRNQLTANFIRAKTQVSSISLEAECFAQIEACLKQRDLTQIILSAFPSIRAVGSSSDYYGIIDLGIQGILITRVKRHSTLTGVEQIIFSNFQNLPRELAWKNLGLLERDLASLQKLTQINTGIIFVGSRNSAQLEESIAWLLGFTQATYVGSVEDFFAEQEIARNASKKGLLLVGTLASDCSEILAKLAGQKVNFETFQIAGIICHGFAPRVCQSCARGTIADKKQISPLPDGLRPSEQTLYMVGRGCQNCGHTGSRGLVSVLSCIGSEDLQKYGKLGSDLTALVPALYKQGIKPLLQIGLQLVLDGYITFESLYAITISLPDQYLPLINQGHSKILDQTNSKQLDYDFSAESKTQVSKPFSDQEAFRGPEPKRHQLEQNTPLFANPFDLKIREKPLLLVVEDDIDQRSILEMLLKAANYDVQLASDGVEALKLVNSKAPDLILTDLMMPRIDGSQFISELKRHPTHKKIPVLVLTVLHDPDKEYQLLDIGADDYCEKTIHRKVLLKRVENLLKRVE